MRVIGIECSCWRYCAHQSRESESWQGAFQMMVRAEQLSLSGSHGRIQWQNFGLCEALRSCRCPCPTGVGLSGEAGSIGSRKPLTLRALLHCFNHLLKLVCRCPEWRLTWSMKNLAWTSRILPACTRAWSSRDKRESQLVWLWCFCRILEASWTPIWRRGGCSEFRSCGRLSACALSFRI